MFQLKEPYSEFKKLCSAFRRVMFLISLQFRISTQMCKLLKFSFRILKFCSVLGVLFLISLQLFELIKFCSYLKSLFLKKSARKGIKYFENAKKGTKCSGGCEHFKRARYNTKNRAKRKVLFRNQIKRFCSEFRKKFRFESRKKVLFQKSLTTLNSNKLQ